MYHAENTWNQFTAAYLFIIVHILEHVGSNSVIKKIICIDYILHGYEKEINITFLKIEIKLIHNGNIFILIDFNKRRSKSNNY